MKIWYGSWERGFDRLTVRRVWTGKDGYSYLTVDGYSSDGGYYLVTIDVADEVCLPSNPETDKKMKQINKRIDTWRNEEKNARKFIGERWLEFCSKCEKDISK